MNYYEHHIGDYAQATAHLTCIEDAIYSRLMRKYYVNEAPIPNDLKLVQRLINARTKDEKNAVAAVLNEFFTLTEDGWRQVRCDHEIKRFKDRQSKAKRSAESRWQAAASLDKTEPNLGCERNANAMRTQCSPDTRHQTPISILQSPDKQQNNGEIKEKIFPQPILPSERVRKKIEQKVTATAPLAPAIPPDLPPVAPLALPAQSTLHQHFAALVNQEGGGPVTGEDCRIRDMVNIGASESDLIGAIATARNMRKKSTITSPINAGYVLAILKCEMHKKAGNLLGGLPWWKTNEGIEAKGRELLLKGQLGESYEAYKERIFVQLRKRKEAANTSENQELASQVKELQHAI